MSVNRVKEEILRILKSLDGAPADDPSLEWIRGKIEATLEEKKLCREARAFLELTDLDFVDVEIDCDGVTYSTGLDTRLIIDTRDLNLEDIETEE